MSIGFSELILIIVLAVVLIKPDSYPEIAYKIGRGYNKIRSWWLDISHE